MSRVIEIIWEHHHKAHGSVPLRKIFDFLIIYRPQRRRQGNHVSDSVHGGGSGTDTPPLQTLPARQTPPYGRQTPAGRETPPWQADTPLVDTPGTATAADGTYPTECILV